MGIVTISAVSVPRPQDAQPSWRQSLEWAVRDPRELCDQLGVADTDLLAARQASRSFSLLVPREFIGRMQPGNARDPLLRQVLPLPEELTQTAGFRKDPVGDQAALQPPGYLRKYARRGLIVTSGACAVHCRYCFRRHFPYAQSAASQACWEGVLRTLAADPSLDEAILSGGDPLALDDEELATRVADIATIPHIRRLRIHTRFPIMIPQRVTDQLLTVLRGTRLTAIVVVQVNHAAELDEATARALTRLVDAGIPLLNQAVLLRGVNDELTVLRDLSLRLVDLRIMPYYLHQLDRVAGAAHFEVPVATGRQLLQQLRESLPGYAVPRYVSDRGSQKAKQLLA